MSTPSLQLRYSASVWQTTQGQSPTANTSAMPVSFASPAWPAMRSSTSPDGRVHSLSGSTMGTTWSLRLSNPDFLPLAPVQALVQSTLEGITAQMSHWAPDSDITRWSQLPAGHTATLPPELGHVLDAAAHWHHASCGAYDPSMGALVNLWGFGPRPAPHAPHSGLIPSNSAIAHAQQHCGWQRLHWDSAQRQLTQPGGVQLDLSGIAKGYAVDAVADALQRAGWAHGLLEIGGELKAWGQRPNGTPWHVALGTHNHNTLPLAHGALATSGDHWHAFEHQGQRYAHTLDPRTGWPVANAMASVTVWHAQCMHADALATVLTVLGAEGGWHFAQQHHIAAALQSHAHGPRRYTDAWRQQWPTPT